jgi:hypothetical protein
MKKFARILLCMSCLLWLTCCEKEFQTGSGMPDLLENFELEFIVQTFSGNPASNNNNDWCDQLWIGEGSSLVYGDFSVEISLKCKFCQGEFSDLMGTFSFIGGGDIFFSKSYGSIICNEGEDCDYYQAIINDLAEITGGTGIFENATGEFYPNARIHNGEGEDWHAFFSCKGNLSRNDKVNIPEYPIPNNPSTEE